jgi:hypothetical protein
VDDSLFNFKRMARLDAASSKERKGPQSEESNEAASLPGNWATWHSPQRRLPGPTRMFDPRLPSRHAEDFGEQSVVGETAADL